jgi:hypothetical protein
MMDDIRFEKMEELIQFYYNELKELLTKLGYDMKNFPTHHVFQQQYLKKSFYSNIFVFTYSDETNAINF